MLIKVKVFIGGEPSRGAIDVFLNTNLISIIEMGTMPSQVIGGTIPVLVITVSGQRGNYTSPMSIAEIEKLISPTLN